MHWKCNWRTWVLFGYSIPIGPTLQEQSDITSVRAHVNPTIHKPTTTITKIVRMHENNYIVAFPHFLFISIFLFSRLFHFVAVERDKNSVLNSNRLIIISCPSHLVCKSIATVCPCPFPPFHSIDCNYRSIIMVLSLTMMLVLFVRLLLL